MRLITTVMVCLFLHSVTTIANAQATDKLVWKKHVKRMIDVGSNDSTSKNLCYDLLNAVRSEKLRPYSDYDALFKHLETKETINAILGPRIDSVTVTDPINGNTKNVAVVSDYQPDTIHKYYTAEHWNFNPLSLETEIEIAGVAPLRDVFVDDDYRGRKAMFWLPYSNIKSIMDNYDRAHSHGRLRECIWRSLFSSKLSPEIQGVNWKAKTERIITFKDEMDTVNHLLRSVDRDSTLFAMLVASFATGKKNVYKDYKDGFINNTSLDELTELFFPIEDGDIVIDPIIGSDKNIEIVSPWFVIDVPQYKLVEEWTFSPATGNIKVTEIGIAPLQVIISDSKFKGYKTMFWLRFDDVRDIVARYGQYHPTNNIATQLWYDYFYSDVKPERLK